MILGTCGPVRFRPAVWFTTSNNQDQDVIYGGRLDDVDRIIALDQSSRAGEIAAIPEVGIFDDDDLGDTRLLHYTDEFLQLDRTSALPQAGVGDACFALHGRFVYYDASGRTRWVVAQLDDEAGALEDHVVLGM